MGEKTSADIAVFTKSWADRVGQPVKLQMKRKMKGAVSERTGRVVYANAFLVAVKIEPEKGKGLGYVETFTASEIYQGLVRIEEIDEMEGESK